MLIASWEDAIGFFGFYLLGLAPFMRFSGIDVIAMPWMTRDFTARKIEQRKLIHPESLYLRLTSKEYWMWTAYIAVLPFITRLSLGMIAHFDRRGIFTSFWVLNTDDEVEFVARNTPARGIMTDRPAGVKKILSSL